MSESIAVGLKMADDWGGFIPEGAQSPRPATGEEVQTFIKSQLNNKIGYYKCLSINNTNNRLFGFLDEDSYKTWWETWGPKNDSDDRYTTEGAYNDELVLCWTDVAKGTPSPYFDFKVVSRLNTANNKFVSINGEVELPITLVCNKVEYDANGVMQTTPQMIDVTLTVEAFLGSSATPKSKQMRYTISSDASDNEITLKNEDLKNILSENGSYTVRMKLTGTLNVDGQDQVITSSYTTFVVVKTVIDVELQNKWYQAQSLKDNNRLELTFNCQGTGVDKYLHYIITGAGDLTGSYPLERRNRFVGTSNRYNDSIFKDAVGQNYNIAAHGIHNIEYWMTLDGDDSFTTPHKTVQIMVIGDSKNSTPYLILKDVNGTNTDINSGAPTNPLFNYSNQNFFKYAVYLPDGYGNTLADVALTFKFKSLSGDDITTDLFEIPVVATTGVDGGYVLEHNIQISDLEQGQSTQLIFECVTENGTQLQHICKPIYVTNNDDYAPSAGAIFVFNPKLRSNQESKQESGDGSLPPIKKIYNTYNGQNNDVDEDAAASTTWSDNISFGDIDGWIDDPAEGRSLRLLRGQSLKIPYQPFRLLDVKRPNITFEMSFKVSNVINENVPLLSICKIGEGEDPIYNGFELRAHDGYFLNNQKKSIANLNDNDIMFAEDERIHLAIRIGTERMGNEVITADIPYEPGKTHSVQLGGNNKVFIRIYLNGVLSRVISVDQTIDYDGTEFGVEYNPDQTTKNDIVRFIQLGNSEPGADLDIYEMRVYQDENIKENFEILKDYTASLPTTEAKDEVIARNNILEKQSDTNSVFKNTPISYQECQNKGINTMLWEPGTASENNGEFTRPNGREFGDTGKKSSKYRIGNLTLNYYDQQEGQRIFNKDKSGTFHNMSSEGQGTTAMLYFKWNQRYNFDDITGHTDVGFVSQQAQEDADKVAAETGTPVVYEYKKTYRLNNNDPLIGRLDAKINWASSMQSHKMGSTALYNDLQKIVVGGHAMNFLNTEKAFEVLNLTKMGCQYADAKEAFTKACEFTGRLDGYGSCRTAIRQEPFMYFVKPTKNSTPVFYGMMTFGASKGDKTTFGYNKKFNPYFIMIEGTDNNRALIEGKTPWDNVHYKQEFDKDEVDGGILALTQTDDEGNGLEQFEVSMGDKSSTAVGPYWNGTNPCLRMFKDMINFVYLHNPHIKVYNADYNTLITDPNVDKSYMYAVKQGGGQAPFSKYADQTQPTIQAYDVFRYSKSKFSSNGVMKEEGWVPAGLTNPDWNTEDSATQYYEHLNIEKQLGLSGGSHTTSSIQNARARRFAEGYKNLTNHAYGWNTTYPNGISDFIDIKDLQFTTNFIKLIAGTDNWSKNTYIYNPGLYFNYDEKTKGYGPSKENATIESDFRGSAKYEGLSKFGFFQDDLDTIFEIDNYGAKTKPYYVEEYDTGVTTDGEKHYWNSHDNAMYRIMEIAYPSEMKSNMYSILQGMQQLGGNPTQCFENYYQNKAQNYFPEVVYNTTAEKLYMDGHYRGMSTLEGGDGNEDTALSPMRYSLFLEQCLGGQLSAENEWIKKRVAYMSSYARFGAFQPGTSGSGISFNPTSNMSMTVTPYIWLYPTMSVGSSPISYSGKFDKAFNVSGRVPAGQQITFTGINAGGEDSIVLKGENYYSDIGNLARVSPLNSSFIIQGKRLTKLSIVGEEGAPIRFDASSTFTSKAGAADNIKVVEIRGDVEDDLDIFELNNVDLSWLWRLETLDLTATNIKNVVLKSGSNIKTLKMPQTLTSLNLQSQTQLSDLQINETNLTRIEIEDPNDYVWERIQTIIKNRAQASSTNRKYFEVLKLHGITWDDMDLNTLEYILSCGYNGANVSLRGVINLSRDVVVDYALKNRLLNTFNTDIDDPESELYITYTKVHVSSTKSIKIIGDDHIYQAGYYQFKLNYKNDNQQEANDFLKMTWKLRNADSKNFTIVNEKTGLVRCKSFTNDLLNKTIELECEIDYRDSENIKRSYTATHTIDLKQPKAYVGDYVYADGTYGSPDKYTGLKTIIGTCFLAYDDKELGVQKRLAVARDLGYMVHPISKNYTGFIWGRNEVMTYGSGNSYQISPDIGATPYINEVATPKLMNTTGRLDTFYTGDFNDTGTHRHIWYVNNVMAKLVQRDLYYYFDKDQYNVLHNNYESLCASAGWREHAQSGTQHVEKCTGARNTEKIIQYRDLGLSALGIELDSISTMEGFKNTMSRIIEDNYYITTNNPTTSMMGKYYPAATYCYLYEPTNLKDSVEYTGGDGPAETLANKFKKNKWFLPAAAELFRIIAYIIRRVDTIDNSQGKQKVLTAFQYYYDTYMPKDLLNYKYFWSSSEYSATYAWRLYIPQVVSSYTNQGNVNDGNFTAGDYLKKSSYGYVLPCVEF